MQKMKQMAHSKDVYSDLDKLFDGDTNQSFTNIQNEMMEDDKNKTVKAQVKAAPANATKTAAVQISKPTNELMYHPSQHSIVAQAAAPVVEMLTKPILRKTSFAGFRREMPQPRGLAQDGEDMYLSAESQHTSSQDAYPGIAMSYQKVEKKDNYLK